MKSVNTVRTSTVMVTRWSRVKSRIDSMFSRIWTVIAPMLFVAFGLFGVNESAWGNSVSSANSSSDISSGKIVMSGNHATFTFSGDKTVEESIYGYSLGTISRKSSASFSFTWPTSYSGYSLKVTKIIFKARAYNTQALSSSNGKVVFNGNTTSIGTISLTSGWVDFSAENSNGLSSGMVVKCQNDARLYPFDYYIKDITITYTITPSAPTIKGTTATVNVSLSDENKLDMTTLIGVSDVDDFMPVSFESNSFSDPQGVSTSGAHTFTGKYFYATKAGVYTFTKPYIAAKSNCHTASSKTNGSISITVNRLDQTLTMKNGSVNVSIDKTNPTDILDLSKCINSHVGNGAVTYTLVSGPTSSTGEVAANNCKIDGKNFSAWVGGTYTLRATAATTAQYKSTTADFEVTVNRLTQTVSWSSAESVFVEEDVVTATSIGDVTLEKSGTGAEYVTIDGNTATVGEVETNSSVTLTATAAQTDVYAQATGSKTITLTSLQKQHITFDQNLTKLKTTDGTKKVELVATSDSGRDSYITFAVDANTAGVSVTQEGGKWYLNYTAAAVKGIAVTASLAGVEGVSIAASDVSQMVKVTDPTDKCHINEPLATASGLANTTKTYDLTIPKQVVLKVRSSKSKIYTNTYEVKFYDKNNKEISTGSTQSWTGRTWDQTVDTRTFSNLNKDIVKMVFKSNASNGFDITEASYTRWSYANTNLSDNRLDFEALALSTVADQTFTLDYANYQVELSIEGSSNFVLKSEDSFGDCEKYGTQTIKVGYNVPAEATEETAFLYIKDNTGTELAKITLHATVQGGLPQNITSTNIQSSYLTTDLVNLTATTDRGLTNFSYSASPAGIANFSGSQMTFSKSGTIAITVTEAGNGAYDEASTTVSGVVVNKVTPTIATNPTVAEIKYKGSFANSQLSEGLATVTLRGVKNTPVAGTFTWTSLNGTQVGDAQGNHDYSVTFTPTDGGMYNPWTFTMPVTISRADGAIQMNNGSVKVKVAGINDDLDEYKIDLDGLVKSKIEDGNRAGGISFAFKSSGTKSVANAEIDANNVFTATAVGTYTIVATQARTDYYEAASVEFTVTVNKLTPTIVFDNTDNPEIIYSGDVIEKPAYRKYNGKEIDRVVSYVSSDPSNTGAIYVAGTTLTARDVQAPEGSVVTVTITASTVADALYNAAEVTATHDYAVRAKRSTYFYLDGDIDATAKTLAIGGTSVITYNENVDENFTVGTEGEKAYITLVHDAVNRTITVTAQKGALAGEGVQTVTVNQPGDSRLWGRNKVYTFTVQKNVSALSLASLTNAMQVEDTVTSIYTGLANTAEAVQFSCSPAGSMKMENGKLIALQAGTNTVTFSQPATEYWTGVSQSKTITVSKKDPNMTTELSNRHAWYSIIEHPFKSLNTEKPFTIQSSNESLAKYIAEEDKIYVYGTSGNVTFTVNQEANYKYNAVENYQKTFTIFQPNNRLPFTLNSSNWEDYKGGGAGSISWDDGGVVVGSTSTWAGPGNWAAKYIILKFVGVPDKLSFDFANTSSIATQYGWHFYQSSNGKDWNLIKEYQDALANATGGTSEGSEKNIQLDPATQYIKLEYHGNYGGRFKNVSVTERKEIAPRDATKDFGLGYNGNDPTTRTIKVDWYNVKPCTVTITGTDADKFVLAEGFNIINSTLDHYGSAELVVSYKHETNTTTSHTATLHIEDEDRNSADVTLTGQTTPAPQTIIWRNDLTPMPIEGSFQNAAMVATGQTVTLESDHPEIVRVVNNTTLEPVSAGIAHITAVAAGNDKWAETTDYLDVEVTTKNVQFITWDDNLSNRKRENGKTVNITLTATSSAGLPITYELDKAAQAFASISGNVLSLTGWGKGQVIAKQVGTEEYVAVQATKSLVSRDPDAGCKPLVGEYTDEYTIWTLGEKEIELNGEPASIEFDAKCDASALWGLWVAEEYDGYYHEVTEISRLLGNNLTSSYKHFGPFELHRNTTKVRIYTETKATMNRTFKNVEVVLAKYLELADNQMNFSQVDKGSTKSQSFYIDYSNLTGVLDVEMENKTNTQFTVLTPMVGEDCGDIGKSVRIDISCTGTTLGTENNKIIISNKDQRLEIPVSATVVLPSQTITWEPELNVLTTDDVVLSATATSELPVSFTSGNKDIADVKYEAGVYSLDIKSYGDVEITAHQAGNENWSAATDKTLTFHISRVVPNILTNPTATGVVLPNTLAASTLEGGSVEGDIAGTFRWQDATINVTKGVASYTAVFDPENDDYYETVPVEVAVPILKTPQTINWAREDVSEEGCSDVVILDATAIPSGLPITYHSSDSTKAYAVDAVINEVSVKKLYILKGGDVTITAEQKGDETYAAAPSVSKTITLTRVIPTIETLPTATDMFVHHFLSNSHPQGGMVKAGENTVEGVFNWEDGSEFMDDPGTNQRTVVFHPYNSDFYQEVSVVIDVEVLRFAPDVTHNFTTETNMYGLPLSEFVLHGSGSAVDGTDPAHYPIEGTFAWKEAGHIPSVSETKAVMVFHPDSTRWYDDVEIEVPITITKATIVSATATATMFYGQVLGDAVFTNTTTGIVNGSVGTVAGTITWDSSLDLMKYYELGDHENLPIRFTPTDPNYESVEMAGKATLTVEAGFVFNGTHGSTWNDDANWQGNEAPVNNNNEKVVILADVNIDTDVSVDAMTIKEGVTVTVKNGAVLTVGNSDSYIRTTYGNLYVEDGGQVILGNGELKVNNFVLEAQLGDNTAANPASSGQVKGSEKLNVAGDAYFRISFDPRGAIDYGWYDFTVPFEVEVLNGVYDANGNKLTNNVDYAVMEYNEARRAANIKAWTWFSGTLQPGKLYSITLEETKTWNTFLFKRKSKVASFGSNTFGASYTDSGEMTDRGWNGMGNGTLRHCQLNNLPAQTKIQVYDHVSDRYVERDADEYTYAVGTAFFVQVDEEQNIDLTAVTETRGFLAPARYQGRTFDEFRLALTAEGANDAADHLWVSASEEATGEYVIGHDLIKMGTPTSAKVAQMWTTNNGLNLCDIEMPLIANKANTNISFFAPQSGLYEIAVERAPEDATLYLTKNGKAIWNLSMNPCELDLEKGTTEGYGLRIVAREQTATDIENVDSFNSEGIRKVMIDNVIYVITPEGKMYDITGKSVKY